MTDHMTQMYQAATALIDGEFPMTELTLEQMKANRKLWVEALRSGKYEQGTGELHGAGKYCCLGVACVIAGKTAADLGIEGTLENFPEVKEFFGIVDDEGAFLADEDETGYLAGENDLGKPFAQIADIIESEPPGLFVESVKP